MPIVKFKISDELFQGFEVVLDLDYFETMDEICKQVTRTLRYQLEFQNFEMLLEKLDDRNFHIHDEEFGSILLKSPEDIVWICSHC